MQGGGSRVTPQPRGGNPRRLLIELRELRHFHYTARRSGRATPPPRFTSRTQPALLARHHFSKQQLHRRHHQVVFFFNEYSDVTDILLWINRPLNANFNPPLGHCLRSRMELRLGVLTSVMKALSEMTPRGLPEAPDLCTPINFECLQSMRTTPCPLTS